MRILHFIMITVISFILFAGCGSGGGDKTVVVYTSVDQVFSEPVLKGLARESGLDIKMVFDTEETKSTGLLNRLVAEAGAPRADVFWSGDPVRPQVLVRKGIAAPYSPSSAADIPPSFKAADGSWVGFSARARVLLVHDELVPAGEEPRKLEDLLDPKWHGKVAVANPAFGTTTMHMAALFSRWGSVRGAAFLDGLRKNGAKIASSNGEVKRLVVAGEVAVGLTDSDDAAVAVRSGAPVRVVYPDADGMGTLLMPTVAVLIKGAPHMDNARRLIDLLAAPEVERRLAFAECAQMPLRPNVERPAHVAAQSSVRGMRVDYERVAEVMEQIHPFLAAWAEGRTDLNIPVVEAGH